MAILKLNSIEYNIVYIDPSIEISGDGSTCTSALKDFPSTLVNDTCYVIRRTSEEYKATVTPTRNCGLKNIIFLGMPKNDKDIFYSLMEEDVKSAWGSDLDVLYANVVMNNVGWSYSDANYCVFYENSIVNFFANNCYFFRNGDGVTATSYGNKNFMFYFGNANYTQNINFNGCKFGYTQYDFDNDDFLENNEDIMTDTNKYPQYKAGAYVYVNTGNVLSFNNCIINEVAGHYYTTGYEYADGSDKVIVVNYFTKLFEFKNSVYNRLYRFDNYDSRYHYGWNYRSIITARENMNSTTRSENQTKAIIENVTFNQITCKTYAFGFMNMMVVNNTNVEVRNVNFNIKSMKNASNNPTIRIYTTVSSGNSETYSINDGNNGYNAILLISNPRNALRLENITADYRESPIKLKSLWVLGVLNCINHFPGNHSSYIRNIDIRFPQNYSEILSNARGVNVPICTFHRRYEDYYYENSSGGYALLTSGTTMLCINNDCIVRNIYIDAPFNSGTGLYLRRFGCKTDELRCKVFLDQSTLDVKKLYNGVGSSYGASVYSGSYLKIDEYEYDENNTVGTYTGNNQIYADFLYATSVYVGKSNGLVFDLNTTYNKTLHWAQECCFVSPNTVVTGQLTARNMYNFAKSWGVVRTGSNSAASIKFENHHCSNSHELVIGQDPYKGIQIVPTSTGKKLLTAYVALKNFDPSELSSCSGKCGYRVSVPYKLEDNTICYDNYSSTVWKDDATSTWSNDTDLVLFKIETVVDIKTVEEPIDIKLFFNWYSPNGYVYFDPDIKIMDLN